MAGFFIPKSVIRATNHLWTRRSLVRDVPYGRHPGMKLDVYGKHSIKEKQPVIMFWHGGGWSHGSKDYYQFVTGFLTRLDAIVVVVGYPIYPKQTFPGFIDDAREAVAWVREHVQEYGGDPDRIFTIGHSSGAHIAAILTLQDTGSIKGCITLALPCTIYKKYWHKIFGNAFNEGLENPISYIGKNKTNHKFLLIHGTDDKLVRFSDSQNFLRALIKTGQEGELVGLAGVGHARVILSIVRPFSRLYPVGKRIKSFIDDL